MWQDKLKEIISHEYSELYIPEDTYDKINQSIQNHIDDLVLEQIVNEILNIIIEKVILEGLIEATNQMVKDKSIHQIFLTMIVLKENHLVVIIIMQQS